MPDDDLSVLLSGVMHALTNKEQRHGSLNAKISKLDMLRLGVEALSHVNQQVAAQTAHPAAAICDPLLSAPIAEALEEIDDLARNTGEIQFNRYCDTLADYAASVSDPGKRRRAGKLLFLLGRARALAQAPHSATNGQAQHHNGWDNPDQQVQPRYRPEQSWPAQGPVRALEVPSTPHPDEPLFKRYMDMGARAGAVEIQKVFNGYDRDTALRFFRTFIEYAITLNSPEKHKVGYALSNAMYGLYREKFGNERAALPSPQRHN